MAKKIKIDFSDVKDELDDYGYPTEEYINFIKNFIPSNDNILDFLKCIAKNWQWCESYSDLYRIGKKYYLELHTGGWSGNEEIIDAIKENKNLKYPLFVLDRYKRGGHYVFVSEPLMKKNTKDFIGERPGYYTTILVDERMG